MEFPAEMYPGATDATQREAILQQIFGDVGELQFDFSCAVETTMLLHGRMYTTNKFLCFYSNLFGVEKKIRIPFSHITTITKENTALVIPNAIAITTNRKEYLFRSFWDRDECFRILQELTEKYKAAAVKGVPATTPAEGGGDAAAAATAPQQQQQHVFSPIIMGSKSLSETPVDLRSILARRSASASATSASPLSPTETAPPTALSLEQRQQAYAQRLKEQQQQNPRSRTTSNASNNSVWSSSTVDGGYSPAGPYATPNHLQQHHHHNGYGVGQPESAAAVAPVHRGGAGDDGVATIRRLTDVAYPSSPAHSGAPSLTAATDGDAAVHSTSGLALQQLAHDASAVEAQEAQQQRLYQAEVLEAAFRDEYRRSLLKERVILNEVLPVSAQQFLDLFYEDDAAFSMKRYHEGTKDRNVQLLPWAPSHTGREAPGVTSFMREMRFMKHITNILAGVRESRAIKVFQLKKFGDVGAVVMSSTRCEDIPAGNTFSVEDSVILRNIGFNRVAVDMSFECKFIARTILKLAIESNTASDMRRWVRGFFDRLKAHCVHYANEHPYVPPPAVVAAPPPVANAEDGQPPSPQAQPLAVDAGDGVPRKAARKKAPKIAAAIAGAHTTAAGAAAGGAADDAAAVKHKSSSAAPVAASLSSSSSSSSSTSRPAASNNGSPVEKENGKTADVQPATATGSTKPTAAAEAVAVSPSPPVKANKEQADVTAAVEQPASPPLPPGPPAAPPYDDPVKPPTDDALKPSANDAVKTVVPLHDAPPAIGSWAFAAYVAGFSVLVLFFMAFLLEKVATVAQQLERVEKAWNGGKRSI